MKARAVARKHRNDKNKVKEVGDVLLKLMAKLRTQSGWAISQGNVDLIARAVQDVQKISTKGIRGDHIAAFVKYYLSSHGNTRKFDEFKTCWDNNHGGLILKASVPDENRVNIDKGRKWIEDNIMQAWKDYDEFYNNNIRNYFDPQNNKIDIVKMEQEIFNNYIKRHVFDMFYKKMVKLRDALKTNIQDIDGFRHVQDNQGGVVQRVGWAGLEGTPQKGRIESAYKKLQENMKTGSLHDMMEEMDEIAVA